MITNTKKPEEGDKKKKKVKAPKTNRKAIDLANGERNKLRRAQRAARNSVKNKAKDNHPPGKNWKRKDGPSKGRRNAWRHLKRLGMEAARAKVRAKEHEAAEILVGVAPVGVVAYAQ